MSISVRLVHIILHHVVICLDCISVSKLNSVCPARACIGPVNSLSPQPKGAAGSTVSRAGVKLLCADS